MLARYPHDLLFSPVWEIIAWQTVEVFLLAKDLIISMSHKFLIHVRYVQTIAVY